MPSFVFDTVDSTNDAAKRLVAEGRLRGRGYVLAQEQTAGRGTQGRSWLSPKNAGIYLSIVRTDASPAPADTRVLTLAAGAACAEALREITSLAIHLKPINDLIAGGRKLGGILTEITIESGAMTSLIIGIGINVQRAARPLPAGDLPAVCIEELLPPDSFRRLDTTRLVEQIVAKVDAFSDRVISEEFDAARPAWEKYLLPVSSRPTIQ